MTGGFSGFYLLPVENKDVNNLKAELLEEPFVFASFVSLLEPSLSFPSGLSSLWWILESVFVYWSFIHGDIYCVSGTTIHIYWYKQTTKDTYLLSKPEQRPSKSLYAYFIPILQVLPCYTWPSTIHTYKYTNLFSSSIKGCIFVWGVLCMVLPSGHSHIVAPPSSWYIQGSVHTSHTLGYNRGHD